MYQVIELVDEWDSRKRHIFIRGEDGTEYKVEVGTKGSDHISNRRTAAKRLVKKLNG
jgi:hypothetical protein